MNPLRTLPAAVLVLALAPALLAQDAPPSPPDSGGSMLDHLRSGGTIGYVICLLSVAGIALVADAFLRLKDDKLMPPGVLAQAHQLAERGRFSEMLTLCRAQDTFFTRVIAAAMSRGQWGVDAVRESMRQQGEKEVTALRQRVGYVGFLAAVAPMLGLLGTVVGLIQSFQVLGESKGAARPDELAVGISVAMVTTELGLIVAVPLMFFHQLLRDRVTRLAQRCAAECETLARTVAVVVETRKAAKPG